MPPFGRDLTPDQRRVLGALASDYPTARVVGWDTSVWGPLVQVRGERAFCVAISPRGKQINRPGKD